MSLYKRITGFLRVVVLICTTEGVLMASQAHAQIPELAPIPPETTGTERDSLEVQRRSLQARFNTLKANVDSFNVACHSVKANSARDAECQRRYQELQRLKQSYSADAQAYNGLVKQLASQTKDRVKQTAPATEFRSGALVVRSQMPGAPVPPTANWDCYCQYRFVTRPNGATHLEAVRTPEQQAAYEALKSLDTLSAKMTELREKYFSKDKATILMNAAKRAGIEIAVVEAVKHYLLPQIAAGDDLRNLKRAAEAVALVLKAQNAWETLEEWREWNRIHEELERTVTETQKGLNVYDAAWRRAQNVPALDHILSQPFSIVFASRLGGSVAIVTRAADGVPKGLTPIGEISIEGTWDQGLKPGTRSPE